MLIFSAPCHAQRVVARGGLTFDPAFVFGGILVESLTSSRQKPIAVRGTVDAAIGHQPAVMVGIVVLGRPQIYREWSPYAGIGPTLVVARPSPDSVPSRPGYVGTGLALVLGGEHLKSRVSLEAQLIIKRDQSPRFNVAVGFRLH